MRSTAPSTAGLGEYVADWWPGPITAGDVISAQRAQQLAATLDTDDAFTDGDALPSLWQWVYFLDWPKTAELGPDGHPLNGHFLPPIPHRRRMFAGGRMTVTAPLVVGQPAVRRSELAAATVKTGRSGELLFVTVRHEYRQDDALRLVEEQDLVYRSDTGTSTPYSRVVEPLGQQSTPWAAQPHPTPALLFRFSALTGNAHRIHYDEVYTTGTEGYPGLVVHGPLLAVYMAELLRAHSADRAIAGFEFRLSRPVFVGDEFRVQGTPGADGVELAVVSGGEAVHASAKARYA
jgi:3-methylfumaryl-CoA hydratase